MYKYTHIYVYMTENTSEVWNSTIPHIAKSKTHSIQFTCATSSLSNVRKYIDFAIGYTNENLLNQAIKNNSVSWHKSIQ